MRLHGSTKVGEGLSENPDTRSAVQEALEPILESVGAHPDVATIFFTPQHGGAGAWLLEEVQKHLGPDVLVGTSAAGVVGGAREVQSGSGLAIWAARFPGTRVQAFHLALAETSKGRFVRGWPDVGSQGGAVLLADPFTFPLTHFLRSLRQAERAPFLVGGLASAGHGPEENLLIAEGKLHRSGAVGFVLDGGVRLQPLLTQGCSPVGQRFKVTRCEENVIYELSGDPALEGLQEVLQGLGEEERRRFQSGPQVGLMVGDSLENKGGGGFLIRGLMGVDRESGAVKVAAEQVEVGSTMQFYARDGESADEEMESMLALASSVTPEAAGALLFTCNGRGQNLFAGPNHDVALLRRYYPDLPVSGFFAAGEVGPVCGQPYLHGFTASVGLFVPESE